MRTITEIKRLISDSGREAAERYLRDISQDPTRPSTRFLYDVDRVDRISLRTHCDRQSTPCATDGTMKYYSPPFSVASPEQLIRDRATCSTSGKEYSLAPAKAVPSFTKAMLSHWYAAANQGDLSSCQGPYCITIVRNTAPKHSNKQAVMDSLSSCAIANINGKTGAPENCETIFAATKTSKYVQAIVGEGQDECNAAIGRPDFNLIIEGVPKRKRTDVLTYIIDRLQAVPLNLTANMFPHFVFGVSDRRLSPILSGYRERVTVRVDVDDINSAGELILEGMMISTDLLVNRQNTDQPSEWHAPSEQQQETYVSAIRATLKQKIDNICAAGHWRDSEILTCHHMDEQVQQWLRAQ